MPIYKGSTPINLASTTHSHTLSDITDAGTAASLDVGTSANNIVQLNGSAQLPAVDGSLLTGISTTDYLMTPADGTVLRYFDDMIGWGQAFYRMGGSGGFYTNDPMGVNSSSGDACGLLRFNTNNANYGRFNIYGPTRLYDWDAPDGTEWFTEIRMLIQTHSSAVFPTYSFGAHCPKGELNWGSSEAGLSGNGGYGDTCKGGIYWQKNQSTWVSSYYDNEGTNGNPVATAITSVSLTAENTFFTVGTHCYKTTLFTVPTWVVDSYLDGTLVATNYLTTGTNAPIPTFCAMYQGADPYQNNGIVDWMSLQFTRSTAINMTMIEDL